MVLKSTRMEAQKKITDDEIIKLKPKEFGCVIRRLEDENMKQMVDHSSMMKEVNRRMQLHLLEIRGLKDVNQRLQDDNQELRDLCCFLDDDRQKGRKLAREWQRFGRYTASVMRQEVSAYQSKLRDLESKQQELIKDNLELKELCLYLDEERVGSRSDTCNVCMTSLQGRRDEGDGSSSSTINEECGHSPRIPPPTSNTPMRPITQLRVTPDTNLTRQRSLFNEQILRYVRGLEKRIQQLEDENKSLTQLIKKTERQVGEGSSNTEPKNYINLRQNCVDTSIKQIQAERSQPSYNEGKSSVIDSAMKVLNVHDKLEKIADARTNPSSGGMGEGQKAIIREMCNVVWKKLEDDPAITIGSIS